MRSTEVKEAFWVTVSFVLKFILEQTLQTIKTYLKKKKKNILATNSSESSRFFDLVCSAVFQ